MNLLKTIRGGDRRCPRCPRGELFKFRNYWQCDRCPYKKPV